MTYNIKMHNSLLNHLSWYQDKDLVYHRELQIDKNTHVSLYGWPLSILTPNRYGIKFDDINGSLLKLRIKIPHTEKLAEINFKPQGLSIQIIILNHSLDLEHQDFYTWVDIRDFIEWKNRFTRE